MDLVVARPEGLYCPPGDFYIDPWRPVDRAVITHAHSDHARTGNRHYLATRDSEGVLRSRLGDIPLETLAYGETRVHNGVRISLHPAGHVLGSAQVRLEHQGQVWVASGDYKLQDDGTCPTFEPQRCDVFITESTFGLPVYRWEPNAALLASINAWWAANAAAGRASVVFCYAFGKAQRILHGLDAAIGPIVTHGAVETLNRVYRQSGVGLPPTQRVSDVDDVSLFRRALVLAPPSAAGSSWMRRFGDYADSFASGWMRLRGARRRRGVDRGFVLSDHADWPGLCTAIEATGAQRVFVTHGNVAVLVRWLNEKGIEAQGFTTEYGAEEDESGAESTATNSEADEPAMSESPTGGPATGEPAKEQAATSEPATDNSSTVPAQRSKEGP